MMNLLVPIDQYCERVDAALFSEPLNALSNASFFIAAFLLMRLYRAHPGYPPARLLIGLIVLVGIGSSLFHTFANLLTMFADIIPITIFVLTFLWFAMRDLAQRSKWQSGMAILLMLALTAICEQLPNAYRFNGSVGYLPCLIALLAVAALTTRTSKDAARLMFYSADIFIISLILRSSDMALCNALPLGTHLFWHLLNGVVLCLLGRAMILHARRNA